MIIVVEPDPTTSAALTSAVGSSVLAYSDLLEARGHLAGAEDVDVVVVGPSIDADDAIAFADSMRLTRPMLGVVLVRDKTDQGLLERSLHAGVREVVKDRDPAALTNAVRRASDLARAVRDQSTGGGEGEAAHHGTVITVFSAKGGAGKTTLSTNLAAAMADNGRRRVCLLDLDLAFGDVAIALQLFPAHTIADAVAIADDLDEDAVRQLLTPHSPGLSTLVAPVEPGLAESIPGPLVSKLIAILRAMHDVVIIDTPPAFTDHVLAAFDESDYVALLATLDIPALKNLKLTLETLDLLNYPRDRWRIVLNRADSKVGLALAEVEKTLRVPIAAQIPSSRDVPAAVNRGVPIVLDAPNHPVSVAVREFGEKLVMSTTPTTVAQNAALPASLRTDQRRFGFRRRAEKGA